MTAKHVILFSGGHSSALVAIEVARRYGAENIILLNHDINVSRELPDVKRFKLEVSWYLGVDITYANHKNWETATPVKVCVDDKAWKVGNGQIICTSRLKTRPFEKWLKNNDPNGNNIYYYGFDSNELARVQRRSSIMGNMGYKTDYPLALWKYRTIRNTSTVGIQPPAQYDTFKHANCMGCLKAGWQHWYVIYCRHPDIWEETKQGESDIGYAIHKDKDGPVYLEDKEDLFSKMKSAGVNPTEHVHPNKFWADAKKAVKELTESEVSELSSGDSKPCECSS